MAQSGISARAVTRRNRAGAAELDSRSEAAAVLLASGAPRTAAVSTLAAQFGVSRRTAQRYVDAGARQLAAETGAPALDALLAESIERLKRLAHTCEARGNLSAAVGAEKAAAGAVMALARLESVAIGHTLAVAEASTGAPTEDQRRQYRRSVSERDPPF
jgi:predicted DNA-binding transcriptional regulator YafY